MVEVHHLDAREVARPRRNARAARHALLLLVLLALLLTAGCAPARGGASASPEASPEPPSALGIDRAAIRERPTSGPEWETLLDAADADLGEVRLRDQESTAAGRTVAAALVHVRTGDPKYREKVVRQLEQVPDSSLRKARVLSVARQLAGFVIAADLVGYRDEAFVEFVDEIRTLDIGNHGRWRTLQQASADTASNWGTWATASRIAASLYIGDEQDVAAAADVMRGFLGDRSAYAGFEPTEDFDPTWACGGRTGWVPINPPDCGDRAGALVEEVSRSGGSYPRLDDVGRTYSWEGLGGALLSAELLADNGYGGIHDWGDRALLRAAQFLRDNGGYPPRFSVNRHIAWMVQSAYGPVLGPLEPAGLGRQYGFTDWLP